jgi:hypothetical protein
VIDFWIQGEDCSGRTFPDHMSSERKQIISLFMRSIPLFHFAFPSNYDFYFTATQIERSVNDRKRYQGVIVEEFC